MAWDDVLTDLVSIYTDATHNEMVTQIKARVLHSLSTAENDVLVGSGANTWIKKTLTEFKTILGLGSAAYTASTAYEPANANIQIHVSSTANPHSVTASQAGAIPTTDIDTTTTLGTSDTKVPSQNAVKTYSDAYKPRTHSIQYPSWVYSSAGAEKAIQVASGLSYQVSSADGDYFIMSVFCSGTETIIEISMKKAATRGIFDLYINDVLDSSGYDTYASSTTDVFTSVTLTQDILPGWNEIKFKVNGKNTSASAYVLAFAGVRLR